jgi:hypothetical protein
MEELYTYIPQKQKSTLFHFMGYDQLTRTIRDEGASFLRGKVTILDESQDLRTLTTGMMKELNAFRECLAMFMLTGTPFVNQTSDLFGLNVLSEVSPVETMKQVLVKKEEFANSKKPERLHYMTEGKDLYRWMYDHYRGRVFFYSPLYPIQTVQNDIDIPMSWAQTFEYVMSSKQTLVFGKTSLTSGVRNSFDVQLRRVSNALLAADNQVIDSNKIDVLVRYIQTRCKTDEDRKKNFPIVVFSRFKNRGIYALEKQMKKAKGISSLRVKSMVGETSNDERAKICADFNSGLIDVLRISKIGRRGLDLLNTKSIIMMEVADSAGEEAQTIARAVRWGKAESQKAEPIQVVRLISTFPDKAPTMQEETALIDKLAGMLRYTPAELVREFDAVKELKAHMKLLFQTVDEKCAARNIEKQQLLTPLELVLKASSIPFLDFPARFEPELNKLLN